MKLVKIFIAAIWALGLALASAAYADPPTIVGRLNYMTGPVSFAPGEAPDNWVAAEMNRPITAGDRLWTDTNGFAEIRVGSLGVRMAPQTSMDVLSLDDRTFQLRVAQGNLQLRVRHLPGDRLIEVATPTGSVVIRQPGSYRINVDPSGDFAIVAVHAGGQAELFTADSSVLVRDNEEAEFSGSSRPQLYAASSLDEFDRWATDRDRRYDTVASTRYVSAEMTGYEDLDYYGQWRTVGDYGNVWIPNSVPTDWAPYRQGHWVWISPWGWTWVDEQPWGFAPFHYGRWVWVNNYWAWAPGRIVERPVYSPALVAFIGGSNFSVAVGAGPAVGWIPLGYREPYIPWYTASRTYVQSVNVTHVTNTTNVTNIRYANRTVPNAVTVVSRDTFVGARPVQRDMVRIDSRRIAAAQVMRESPVTQPVRTSFARSESGSRPPAQVIARESVTVHKPTAPSRQIAVRDAGGDQQTAKAGRSSAKAPPVATAAAQLPPVRVIERRQRVSVPVEQAPRAEARASRQVTQAPRAEGPAAQQRQPQVVQETQRDLQSRQGEQAREQQGERLREQKNKEADQQKAQALQQAEQLDREKKQRAGQQEQRAQPGPDQGQKAAQEQRNREEQQRAQQERDRGQKAAQDRQREDQQRAQQERERGQKAAQDQRQRQEELQQKAQQDQQRQQQARQQQQRQDEQQKAQQERERQQGAALEQQRAREQQQKAAQEQQQRAAQEQQRQQQAAQQQAREQQRAQEQQRQQQAAQQQAAQQQARAQQEQQKQQQAAQQAAQQQARAQQEQQRQQQAAQQAAQQQARAQQEQQKQQQAAQQAAPRAQQPQEAEKAKRERGKKDQAADKD